MKLFYFQSLFKYAKLELMNHDFLEFIHALFSNSENHRCRFLKASCHWLGLVFESRKFSGFSKVNFYSKLKDSTLVYTFSGHETEPSKILSESHLRSTTLNSLNYKNFKTAYSGLEAFNDGISRTYLYFTRHTLFNGKATISLTPKSQWDTMEYKQHEKKFSGFFAARRSGLLGVLTQNKSMLNRLELDLLLIKI